MPFTGVVEPTDTLVEVPLNSLRIANSKMTELKFEKEINGNLRQVISNDSLIIQSLNNNIKVEQNKSKQYKRQRNVVGGTSIGLLILLLISLL